VRHPYLETVFIALLLRFYHVVFLRRPGRLAASLCNILRFDASPFALFDASRHAPCSAIGPATTSCSGSATPRARETKSHACYARLLRSFLVAVVLDGSATLGAETRILHRPRQRKAGCHVRCFSPRPDSILDEFGGFLRRPQRSLLFLRQSSPLARCPITNEQLWPEQS
jgi:hypothetical protein